MFGFKKKEQRPLLIHAKEIFSLIKSDYEAGTAFCLIEFELDGRPCTMGSVLDPDCEETREHIYFVFENKRYDTYEEFERSAEIGGVNLFLADPVITVVRAGIIDGEAVLKTPWGDTRLRKLAIQD